MTETYSHRSLPPDTMVQEYKIESVLGAGNFGIVYRASNIYLDEIVAIKEFLPVELANRSGETQIAPLSCDTEKPYFWALDRFLKEAKILWELGQPEPNPNIIRVMRFHKANGTAYMVMEYEEGEPLSEILSKQEKLSQEQIESILFPLLDGLERVHARSVLHRDIKPSNILIRSDGSPVLIDFGAARRDFANPTHSTIAVYSPMYAPPEQITPVGEQGPWTDIYSLGATLYHAVTGKAPTYPLARIQGAAFIPAIEATTKDYSPNFLTAIDKAIELVSTDRPQSVAEFRNLLGNISLSERQREGISRTNSCDDVTVMADRQSLKPPSPASNVTKIESIPKPESKNVILWTTVFVSIILAITLIYFFLQPLVDRDALTAQIQELSQGLDCSFLKANLTDDLELRLSGHVSTKAQIKWLKDRLQLIDSLKEFRMDLKVYEPPFCLVISTLQHHRKLQVAPENQIWLDFNKSDRIYRIGNFLVINAKAGLAYNGYLYLDYFDGADNIVTHMFPSPVRSSNALHARESVVVGAEKQVSSYISERSYELLRPGKNLVVAIYSKGLLFGGLRPEEEPISEYLTVLQSALNKIPKHQKPIVSFEFITITQ